MLGEILRRRRLVTGALLLAGWGALVVIGCVARLTLSDIASVPHARVTPVLRMGADGHGKRGVDCVDCHEGAKTEDRAGMPDRNLCMLCHEEVDEAKEKLALGGPLFDPEGKPKWKVLSSVPTGVLFSHAKHTGTRRSGRLRGADDAALDCAECHGDIAREEYALAELAGKFVNCQRCHALQASSGDCSFCHSALDEGALPHSHDAAWPRAHGRQVRDSGGLDTADETCGSCHRTSYCLSCHQEEAPRDHTIFFTRAGHGLAADIDRERCGACHLEDRCLRCHLGGTPPRPPGHPAATACTTCHSGTKGHVLLTDNCLLCHK